MNPLDPVRSIKVKLGLLVVGSTSATALATWFGLAVLGWWPRYVVPVAVLLSLVVTQVLAHGMTSPLRAMTAAARAMAAGRPRPAVPATSRDEVGELARAFSAMAAELDDVERQRQELLGNVGHELRTPLAALRAQLENLADGVTPSTAEALAEPLVQVERLGDLVEDLLALARAGSAALHLQDVDVRALVDRAVGEATAARAGSPEVRVVVRVDEGLRVTADERRLRQVVVNLLDNALRHAPRGTPVEVAARRSRDVVVLDVRDRGPGIPPEQREAVFERFRRGVVPGAPGTSPDGGTGLGLAIVRWAVGLHGGSVRVVEAAGCCVRVELPACATLPR